MAKLSQGTPKQPFLNAGDVPRAMAYIVKGLLKAIYTNTEGERVNVNFFREDGVGDYQAFYEHMTKRYDFMARLPLKKEIYLLINKQIN